jgi:hypothetical protein
MREREGGRSYGRCPADAVMLRMDEDVGGLEVAVDEAEVVEVAKARRDVEKTVPHIIVC